MTFDEMVKTYITRIRQGRYDKGIWRNNELCIDTYLPVDDMSKYDRDMMTFNALTSTGMTAPHVIPCDVRPIWVRVPEDMTRNDVTHVVNDFIITPLELMRHAYKQSHDMDTARIIGSLAGSVRLFSKEDNPLVTSILHDDIDDYHGLIPDIHHKITYDNVDMGDGIFMKNASFGYDDDSNGYITGTKSFTLSTMWCVRGSESMRLDMVYDYFSSLSIEEFRCIGFTNALDLALDMKGFPYRRYHLTKAGLHDIMRKAMHDGDIGITRFIELVHLLANNRVITNTIDYSWFHDNAMYPDEFILETPNTKHVDIRDYQNDAMNTIKSILSNYEDENERTHYRNALSIFFGTHKLHTSTTYGSLIMDTWNGDRIDMMDYIARALSHARSWPFDDTDFPFTDIRRNVVVHNRIGANRDSDYCFTECYAGHGQPSLNKRYIYYYRYRPLDNEYVRRLYSLLMECAITY